MEIRFWQGVVYALSCASMGLSFWCLLRLVTNNWMTSSQLTAMTVVLVVGTCSLIRFINNRPFRELEKALEEHDRWHDQLLREHEETVEAHVAAVRRRR